MYFNITELVFILMIMYLLERKGKKERDDRLDVKKKIHNKKKKEFIYPDLQLTFHLTFRPL